MLPDPPPGPLHVARARASFPWKELALFWEGEDTLRFKVRLGWWPLGALVARGEGHRTKPRWQNCSEITPSLQRSRAPSGRAGTALGVRWGGCGSQ